MNEFAIFSSNLIGLGANKEIAFAGELSVVDYHTVYPIKDENCRFLGQG